MTVPKSYYEEFELDLSGVCNLSCPLCTRNYAHAQHTVYKHIRPLSEIVAQLDEYTGLKKCFLAGQVSEPTLYPEFLDFIRYLVGRNIQIRLFTNGSTRNPDFFREISKILKDTDEIHFTICGSTQEIHSKYRIGSSLEKILENAKAYKESGKTNDYCQFIRFQYNEDDEENVKALNFTNHYTVDSEGDRLINDKVKQSTPDVRPLEKREKLIKWVLKTQPSSNKVSCKWLNYKKIYFDQKGEIYPCYMHCEYKDGPFERDYTDIQNFKFSKCILCDSTLRKRVQQLDLDFLC